MHTHVLHIIICYTYLYHISPRPARVYNVEVLPWCFFGGNPQKLGYTPKSEHGMRKTDRKVSPSSTDSVSHSPNQGQNSSIPDPEVLSKFVNQSCDWRDTVPPFSHAGFHLGCVSCGLCTPRIVHTFKMSQVSRSPQWKKRKSEFTRRRATRQMDTGSLPLPKFPTGYV